MLSAIIRSRPQSSSEGRVTNHSTIWYRSVVIKYDQTKCESQELGGGGGEGRTHAFLCVSPFRPLEQL